MKRYAATGLLLLLSASALMGGYGLVRDPSGALIGLPLELLAPTLFRDYLIPGMVLFIANGLLSAVVALLVIRRARNYPMWVMAQGAILFGWLSVQLLLNPAFWDPLLHVSCYAIAFLLLGLGYGITHTELAYLAEKGPWHFENSYKRDVRTRLERTALIPDSVLSESDLQAMPLPVQAYLRYTGAMGQPKVWNVRIVFRGEMRERGRDWFSFTSEQHNFFDEPERLFFMKAIFKGLPTSGYHAYKDGHAAMNIKVLSLIPVVSQEGDVLNQAETVTLFNDMCLMAPGALIDPRIAWEVVDDTTARATFTHHGISISAVLYFNTAGQLVNFVSDDRYDVNAAQQYRFSTPVRDYKEFGSHRLGSYGEAIWHYPEGEFAYGRFYLQEVQYNVAAE